MVQILLTMVLLRSLVFIHQERENVFGRVGAVLSPFPFPSLPLYLHQCVFPFFNYLKLFKPDISKNFRAFGADFTPKKSILSGAAGENFDLLNTKIVDSSCKKRVLHEQDHLKLNVFLKSPSVLLLNVFRLSSKIFYSLPVPKNFRPGLKIT